jgi:hypothetical protein
MGGPDLLGGLDLPGRLDLPGGLQLPGRLADVGQPTRYRRLPDYYWPRAYYNEFRDFSHWEKHLTIVMIAAIKLAIPAILENIVFHLKPLN